MKNRELKTSFGISAMSKPVEMELTVRFGYDSLYLKGYTSTHMCTVVLHFNGWSKFFYQKGFRFSESEKCKCLRLPSKIFKASKLED